MAALCVAPAWAETKLRIATYATELERDGPGLLLRDITKSSDPQVEAIAQVIATVKPDILVLQGIDYDYHNNALKALRDRVEAHGWYMAHAFSRAPNTGRATGLDMDGDNRTGQPRDAQGYGAFFGQGGMALLSRYTLLENSVQNFTDFLWRDLPDALLPSTDTGPFPSQAAQNVQRLSSVGHWVVPILIEGRTLNLMTFHAAPPVFDGPEDSNGRRNHDEIAFWLHYLDGSLEYVDANPFVIAGDANSDPVDGDSRKSAIGALLADPRLQDPMPARSGLPEQGVGHKGDPRLDTVAWPVPEPGHLRVSYVLPSADLEVTGSGIMWPETGEMAAMVDTASRHRLIWVDLMF